jgi:hypothetical protein
MLEMGMPPVQIHVMTSISGSRGMKPGLGVPSVRAAGIRSPSLARDAFLRNKRAAGRLKDLADIDALAPGGDDSR